MPLFTRENAREFAARGNKARWSAPQSPAIIPAQQPRLAQFPDFSSTLQPLADALSKTLTLMAKEDDAKARAFHARALKDIRDTWHMITGQPLPGRTKPPPERRGRVVELAPEPVDLPGSPLPLAETSAGHAMSNLVKQPQPQPQHQSQPQSQLSPAAQPDQSPTQPPATQPQPATSQPSDQPTSHPAENLPTT